MATNTIPCISSDVTSFGGHSTVAAAVVVIIINKQTNKYNKNRERERVPQPNISFRFHVFTKRMSLQERLQIPIFIGKNI